MTENTRDRRKRAISLRGVDLTYQRANAAPVHALRGISLDIAEGEFLSVVGPTGCGKSSLLRVLCGLVNPTSGEVAVAGLSPTEALRRHKISVTFQADALLPWRTVEGNVRLPSELLNRAAPGMDRTAELLDLVGLSGFADYYPSELSGGMRQRAAIARALNSPASIVFMDEPFQALDEQTRNRLNGELLRIWSEMGLTMVFVTHSITEAIYLGNRVCALSSRPGHIKAMVDVPFAYPRAANIRHDPKFVSLAQEIFALLEVQ